MAPFLLAGRSGARLCQQRHICIKFAVVAKMRCIKIDTSRADYIIAVKINYIFLVKIDNRRVEKSNRKSIWLLTNYAKVLRRILKRHIGTNIALYHGQVGANVDSNLK